MARVLVTGATGFVGRATVGRLVAAGHEVHAISSDPDARDDLPAGVTWHAANLLAPAAGRTVRAIGAQRLVHLAWYAEPGRFWRAPENLAWVGASLRLLRAFREAGGERAVVAGTCAEYAWSERTHCREGATPLDPATLYGAAKHGLHLVAAAYAAQEGFSLAWGRVFFVFGEHEHPARLAPSVALALLEGRPAEVTEGRQVRDFLAVAELGGALAALLDSGVEGPVNLASGEPVELRELIGALAAATGREDLVRYGARPTPAGEPAELTADAGRLRDEVGWRPERPWRERVAEVVDWWRERYQRNAS